MPDRTEPRHRLRSLSRCAEHFGIPRNRLARLLKDGRIPYVRLGADAERLIDDLDVADFIAASKVRRSPEGAP